MSDSRFTRQLFVGTLVALIAAMLVLTGWLLRPSWEVYQLLDSVQKRDVMRIDQAIAKIKEAKRVQAAVGPLVGSMNGHDDQSRGYAAYALRALGPEAEAAAVPSPEAIPALVVALGHENPYIGIAASETLARAGPAAVPALTEALNNTNSRVRWRAAESLSFIGPASRPAVPSLIKNLSDPDEHVRSGTCVGLGGIGPDAKDAIGPLIEAMRDTNTRLYAAGALGRIGPPAVPALIESLSDGDARVRDGAVFALGRAGSRAKAAIPTLSNMLQTEPAWMQKNLLEALKRIDPDTEQNSENP